MSVNKVRTSEFLARLAAKERNETFITLGELKEALHERGFGILLLVLSLPLTIPLPFPPAYTTILAVPLLVFSGEMLLGCQSVWLPGWLERRSVRRSYIAFFLRKTAPMLRVCERFTRHRFAIFNTVIGEKIYALVTMCSACCIALPLPMTNCIPATGIVLMSLGLLNKDGIFVLLGIVVAIVGNTLTIRWYCWGTIS